MNEAKYIGLDVHQATISVAVRDSAGKLVVEGKNNVWKHSLFCLQPSTNVYPDRATSHPQGRDVSGVDPHTEEVLETLYSQ